MEDIRTVIRPLPSIELVKEKEEEWCIELPSSFKEFIIRYNGIIPKKNLFKISDDKEYVIERFLCILDDFEENSLGVYNIDVIWSPILEILSVDPDSVGVELLPVATLFGGDFICLDYREGPQNPKVCYWKREDSYEWHPSVEFVSETFEDFLGMLYSEDDIANS